MRKVTICMAVAGLLLVPALAWADGACCGQTTDNNAAITTSSDISNGCGACATCCKPKCGFCNWLSGKCGHKCDTCGSCTVKQKVQCCTEKTSYKLVRSCEPVCRQRTVSYRDPCNPCCKSSRVVNECHNHTCYRWVCETKPVCHTKTIRVCSTCNPPAPAAPCCGQPVSETAFGGTTSTVQTLASTVHHR
jgi:hypothetical protein